MRIKAEYYALMLLVAVTLGAIAGLQPGSSSSAHRQPSIDDGEVWKLVVFETASSGWCVRFRKDIAPGYRGSKYQKLAPLTYVGLDRPQTHKYQLSGRISVTPTVVLVDADGREINRLQGYPGNDRLYTFLARNM